MSASSTACRGMSAGKTRALVLVPAVQQVAPASFTENLPLCKGCRTPIRPHGATEAEFPGTAASWGNNECRVCDYLAAGKDPADRFIPVQRVSFLTSLRHDIEAGRRRRGIPAAGSMSGRIPITEFVNTLKQGKNQHHEHHPGNPEGPV